jgi:hypothetical protein
VTVSDDDSGSTSKTTSVTVNNVAPVITSITGTTDPVALGGSVSVTATFTDVGKKDTHTCQFNWDDTTTSTVVATETVGSGTGSCAASHVYTTPGVYSVTVTVKDDDGGMSDAATYTSFIVVYDPNGGFVTGGGYIVHTNTMSPNGGVGAKDNYGFVAKYKKNSTLPEGETQFQYKPGNIDFHSSSLDWLVISGTRAQYQGTGTINGIGSYGFQVTAIQGNPDRFRIRIWNKTTLAPVFDSEPGQPDTWTPVTPAAGGNIVIHK